MQQSQVNEFEVEWFEQKESVQCQRYGIVSSTQHQTQTLSVPITQFSFLGVIAWTCQRERKYAMVNNPYSEILVTDYI
ncbi:hypothetical protein HNS25_24045, partial [Escherichia coli]|uniref:hypothetical protein n=1 Tax=Escherichia coli TaxID=562 RepID=UPI00214D67A3